MYWVWSKKSEHYKQEQGFSLVLALIFTGLMAATIATIVTATNKSALEEQANAVGWYAARVAEAARVYVRDQAANPSSSYTATSLDASPRRVSFNNLFEKGLLPPHFSTVSPMNQNVWIIAVNHPYGGDPTDPGTVPTAYVYLEDSPRSAPSIIMSVAEELRRQGIPVIAPSFSAAGDNISNNCGGDPAISIWDTGCLDETTFDDMLAVVSSAAAFGPGALVLPSWKNQNLDTRAVMRYPQPENPSSSTMMTDMDMAQVNRNNVTEQCANRVEVNSGTTMEETSFCRSENDETGIDRRFNIIGVKDLYATHIVAENQSANETETDEEGTRTAVIDRSIIDRNTDPNIQDGNPNDVIIHRGELIVGTASQNAIASAETRGELATARIFAPVNSPNAISRFAGFINRNDGTSTTNQNYGFSLTQTGNLITVERSLQLDDLGGGAVDRFARIDGELDTEEYIIDEEFTYSNGPFTSGPPTYKVFQSGDGTVNNSSFLGVDDTLDIVNNLQIANINNSATLTGRTHTYSTDTLSIDAQAIITADDATITNFDNVMTITTTASSDAVRVISMQIPGDIEILGGGNLEVTGVDGTQGDIAIRDDTNITGIFSIGVATDGITATCFGDGCPRTDPDPDPPL